MLSAEERGQILKEIDDRWATISEHLSDARAELDIIKVFKRCLALDDSLHLRVAASDGELRGDSCSGLRVIHGGERLSK